MAKSFNLQVNPDALKWARTLSGYSIEDISKHIKQDSSVIEKWEETGTISFSGLKAIAGKYKRPLSIFFLNKQNFTPGKFLLPTDFRNLPKSKSTLSPELCLAVRRTQNYLNFYREQTGPDTLNGEYNWLNSSDLITPDVIRKLLGLTSDLQRGNYKFRDYRYLVESKLALFVFCFKFSHKECDGFSYVQHGLPYAIVIENGNSDTRKTFTLFHELAHIVKRSDSLCLIEKDSRGIEAECNRFAAEVLMPKERMSEIPNFDFILKKSREIGVSPESYTIRAKGLGLIENINQIEEALDVYKRKYLLEQQEVINKKAQKLSKGVNYNAIQKNIKGNKLFDFVEKQFLQKNINYADVRSILGIRASDLL
jgi:Zn-dependent peptidase ImmA (M78 family)